jgi:hypothetical protein
LASKPILFQGFGSLSCSFFDFLSNFTVTFNHSLSSTETVEVLLMNVDSPVAADLGNKVKAFYLMLTMAP